MLSKKPHILISTAGRLWDLIDKENVKYLKTLPGVKYLVLDEADRMIELGQFKEISKVLNFLYKQCLDDQAKMIRAKGGEIEMLDIEKDIEGEEGAGIYGEENWDLDDKPEDDDQLSEGDAFAQSEEEPEAEPLEDEEQEEEENEEDEEDEDEEEEGDAEFDGDVDETEMQMEEQSIEYEETPEDGDPMYKNVEYLDGGKGLDHDLVLTQPEIDEMRKDGKRRRTFVVSATIGTSFWTSRFMNRKVKKETKKKRKTDPDFNPKIAEIMDKLNFNFKMKTVDMTKDQLLPTNLEILKINIHHAEKLLHLTHFVRTFEGQDMIIFSNSIPATKKIRAVLEVMNIESVNLHSHQQQKQRLAKLDSFRNGKKRILVATDVASRGLDIPQCSVVIHYHTPKDLDTFLHRCGRTARTGGKDGKAIMIADADDQSRFVKWKRDLPANVIKNVEVNIKLLDEIRHFVNKAGVIEKENFKIAKENKELYIKKKFAGQLEVDITEDEQDDHEKEDIRVAKEKREKLAKVETMKYKKVFQNAEEAKFKTLKRGVFLQPADMAGMLEELKKAKMGEGAFVGRSMSKSRAARMQKKHEKKGKGAKKDGKDIFDYFGGEFSVGASKKKYKRK